MCGIVGFVCSHAWREEPDLSLLAGCVEDLEGALKTDDPEASKTALEGLAGCFPALMSFGLHHRIRFDPDVKAIMGRMSRLIGELRCRAEALLALGRTEEGERLHEALADYAWQLDRDILGPLENAPERIPARIRTNQVRDQGLKRSICFMAWAIENVLQSLDKLEVRGRDSAGISISFTLAGAGRPEGIVGGSLLPEYHRRLSMPNPGHQSIYTHRTEAGRSMRFIYKVANTVGRLGDNGRHLRNAIAEDPVLWVLAGHLEDLNIMAHTRWASNGIINIDNCHPVDGSVVPSAPGKNKAGADDTDRDVLFVLNGDVDNYALLVDELVSPKGVSIPPSVTTDAKILPVLYHLHPPAGGTMAARFVSVLRQCEGSLAVGMQHPERIDRLMMAQKGSGQSLYLGRTVDGWLAASEAYGIASFCRWAYPLVSAAGGGVMAVLSGSGTPEARYLESGEELELKREPIEIHSRDIYRGGFDYYIDKEIREAPKSARRTIQSKYEINNGRLAFRLSGLGNGASLIDRLHAPDRPAIRKICVIGQGTASIAASGAAHLIRRALKHGDIEVKSLKSSELIGFSTSGRSMEDMLVIAVSQSGSTTDTNRVVDLCRRRGAWVHAIVNRRNSPLVLKSDSHIYTSNGRDVEMAVASTKAFYSQIAAGAIMALLLASEWNTLSNDELLENIRELESLPPKIESVLAQIGEIRRCARQYAPRSRYWAVVGNGPNHIAAEEIRIKLSELCYKSIPCDFTEDKKHIDLSTEPLTLVVTNDLPETVVSDTVKEVSIFKAHKGRPLVFCSADENRFDSVAEAVIKLPGIGGGLGFVLAAVAGHLWGIEAAKAIDSQAEKYRLIRSLLTDSFENPALLDKKGLLRELVNAFEITTSGSDDSALPARLVAGLAKQLFALRDGQEDTGLNKVQARELLELLNQIIDETARPIDSIRHQAKTVTVGVSRPEPISPGRQNDLSRSF